MIERMTDERLAEIELDRGKIEKRNWQTLYAKELLLALKAERQEVAAADERIVNLSAKLLDYEYGIVPELQFSLAAAEARIEKARGFIRQFELSEIDDVDCLSSIMETLATPPVSTPPEPPA